MEYLVHLAILVFIQCILALTLDLVYSQLGMVSLAHAVNFGAGAYAAAIVMTRFEFGFLPAITAAAITGGVSGYIAAAFMSRLSGDEFTVATIGLQLLFTSLILNSEFYTGGPFGIKDIPQLTGWELSTHLYIALILCCLLFGTWKLRALVLDRALGRALIAIDKSPHWAVSMGLDPQVIKALVGTGGGALAGATGACYAVYFTYIDPSSFSLTDSVNIVTALLLGGLGTRWGPVRGAIAFVLLPEALRFFGVTTTSAAYIRQACVGSILVLAAVLPLRRSVPERSLQAR